MASRSRKWSSSIFDKRGYFLGEAAAPTGVLFLGARTGPRLIACLEILEASPLLKAVIGSGLSKTVELHALHPNANKKNSMLYDKYAAKQYGLQIQSVGMFALALGGSFTETPWAMRG